MFSFHFLYCKAKLEVAERTQWDMEDACVSWAEIGPRLEMFYFSVRWREETGPPGLLS